MECYRKRTGTLVRVVVNVLRKEDGLEQSIYAPDCNPLDMWFATVQYMKPE